MIRMVKNFMCVNKYHCNKKTVFKCKNLSSLSVERNIHKYLNFLIVMYRCLFGSCMQLIVIVSWHQSAELQYLLLFSLFAYISCTVLC
jgi:hypothetical protein